MADHTDFELEYAATARCACGAGLAYPLDPQEALTRGAWECSAVLKGEASPESQHDRLPFAFCKVREETSINNRGGHTTRPAGTVCMIQGHFECPTCKTKWTSELYQAHGLNHHAYSGPCPGCGYAVGAGGSWSSSDGKSIECRYKSVVVEAFTICDAASDIAAQPAKVAEAWRPIKSAPKDTVGVAILARMTCCGGGAGLVVMTAARSHGVWIYPSEHTFEFIRWCPLPPISEAFEVAGRG